MRIFITGATGFIGSALARQWSLLPDRELILLARNASHIPVDLQSLQWHISDINNINPAAFGGADIVIHAAARAHDPSAPPEDYVIHNTRATQHMAECAAKAGVKRFIFLSTIKVNGEFTDAQHPFHAADTPRPVGPYAVSKWQAEQHVRKIAEQHSMEWVIVRPTVLYGPGMKGNMLLLWDLVRRGLPLPLGSITNKRSLLGLDNMVAALERIVENKNSNGQVFLLSDGVPVSTPDIIRCMAAAMGKPARLLPVPPLLIKAGCTLLGKEDVYTRLCSSLHIDDSETYEQLHWRPPLSFAQGIQQIQDNCHD